MDQLQDKLARQLRGSVLITAKNEATGEEKIIAQESNLVVNKAYEQLAALLGNISTPSKATRIAFGTGSTAAAVGDTALGTPTGPDTTGFAVTYPVAYTARFTAQWATAISELSNIQEVGLFASSTLLARFVFGGPMQKSTGWTWTIQWDFAYTV